MKPVILERVKYDPVDTRLWIVTNYPKMMDSQGIVRSMPRGLLLDFWSTPRFFWSRRPPVIGDISDDVAAWHDFFTRCHAVSGLGRRYTQREFYAGMVHIAPNISRSWAAIKTGVTWPAVLKSDGSGIHANPRYNGPVYSETTGIKMSLPEWVRGNYREAV